MKKIETLLVLIPLQVLSLAPLAVYPAVVLASVMSLAGHRTGDEPPGLLFVVNSFCILSIVYPAPAIACSILAWRDFKKLKGTRSVILALLPVLLLCVILLLLRLWASF